MTPSRGSLKRKPGKKDIQTRVDGYLNTAARPLLNREEAPPGETLCILVDDGEPIRNVPPSLEEQGHAIFEKSASAGRWRLVVRRGGPA